MESGTNAAFLRDLLCVLCLPEEQGQSCWNLDETVLHSLGKVLSYSHGHDKGHLAEVGSFTMDQPGTGSNPFALGAHDYNVA